MKRVVCLMAMALVPLMMLAQSQQGYVKTKGRMVNGLHVKGKGLTGAVVALYGRTSVGVQNADGSFSFPVVGKSYTVQSVTKKGYQLVDADAAPKAYAYSGNPLYLVIFLDDFKLFAEAGVIPKEREADVEKIKKMLNEK